MSDTMTVNNLKEVYEDLPVQFFFRFIPDFKWPAVLRKIFLDIYNGKINRAILKGPRGGGKSQLLSALAFSLWFFKKRKVIDMGGAFAQAKIVYNYILGYLNSNATILASLDKPPLMQHTIDQEGNYVKCVPASPRQVRGPHPDVLLGDEVCECKDELIEAAIPMVDSSQNPVIVLTSTFHKIFGIFQDIWDKAEEKGYTRYSWDIFDVTKKFDPAIWEDETLNREIDDLEKLRKLSKGKTGDTEGWIPIENVIQAWREKASYDYFLVEYMGERASQVAFVNDAEDVDAGVFKKDKVLDLGIRYKAGAECVLGIDWGFSSMTAIVDLMSWKDSKKVLLENKNYTQVRLDVIIEDVIEILKERPRKYVYADSAGKFENEDLRKKLNEAYNNGILKIKPIVVEVVFSKDKEELLGSYRSHFQKKWFIIPDKFKTAIWQHKRYRYQEGSDKPLKKDDHIPDATICALKHFNKPKTGHISDIDKERDVKTITSGLIGKRF